MRNFDLFDENELKKKLEIVFMCHLALNEFIGTMNVLRSSKILKDKLVAY